VNTTKNDLSFNKVTLDYRSLVLAASYAYGLLLESVSKRQRELLDAPSKAMKDPEHHTASISLGARWLYEDVSKLQIVAETLATLIGGLDRDEIVIVNKQ